MNTPPQKPVASSSRWAALRLAFKRFVQRFTADERGQGINLFERRDR